MTELASNTLHGQYPPEKYKRGEKSYRFLRNALTEWDMVTVSFLWPETDNQRWVRVKGVVERVFRDREVPYVQLPYLEHDPDIFEMIGPIVSALQEHPVLDEAGTEALTDALNFTFQTDELARETGIIPEGLYVEGEVQINLCGFALIGCGLSREASQVPRVV